MSVLEAAPLFAALAVLAVKSTRDRRGQAAAASRVD